MPGDQFLHKADQSAPPANVGYGTKQTYDSGVMLSAPQRKKGPRMLRHTGTYLGRSPSRQLVRSLVENDPEG